MGASNGVDKVFIEHLVVRGKHGVTAEERAHEQEFSLDIEIQFDTHKASVSDDLSDTVSYGHFRSVAKEVVEVSSYHLLEKLANTIAERILEDVRVASVSITVRKTKVYPDCTPGVMLERTRT